MDGGKMKKEVLTVNVPVEYKNEVCKIAEKYDLTISEAFRHIYGLDSQEFAFTFSAKEKPLLKYVQTMAVINYGFEDYVKRQVEFYREKKNEKKEKFYEWIFRKLSPQRSFINQTLLPSLEEGFESLTDKAAEKQLKFVESLMFLLEHGNRKDWDVVNGLAKQYMNKSFLKK